MLGSGPGGGSLGDSVLGSLLAFVDAVVSDLPGGEGGFSKGVNCSAPESAVLGFRAEVHEVMVVGERCDAKENETVFSREALEVLAKDLVEESFLPTDPGSYLNRVAVTGTAGKKLEHDLVGRKSWIAAVDVPEKLPPGPEKLDRDGKGLGKVIEVLAGDANWVVEA